jgi:hypothetical protein
LQKLTETGNMSSVRATCIEETKICFPTTSAAVISSSACLRLESQQQQSEEEEEPVPGDAAAVVAMVNSPAPAALLQGNEAKTATAASPQTRPVAEMTAASSVYATPTHNSHSRLSTPPTSRVSSVPVSTGAAAAAQATTPEGKKGLSARSSTQHAQQDQLESPSLRDTFGILTKGSPEISTAAA